MLKHILKTHRSHSAGFFISTPMGSTGQKFKKSLKQCRYMLLSISLRPEF